MINFGSKNPQWKSGKTTSSGGYVMVRTEGHPRATKKGFYVFEHILVMENKLKRYLSKKEEVHHQNENKKDNRLRNLILCESHSKHMKNHKPSHSWKKGMTLSEDAKRRISVAKSKYWEKWRAINGR